MKLLQGPTGHLPHLCGCSEGIFHSKKNTWSDKLEQALGDNGTTYSQMGLLTLG